MEEYIIRLNKIDNLYHGTITQQYKIICSAVGINRFKCLKRLIETFNEIYLDESIPGHMIKVEDDKTR